jgi:hypothetical protein
MRSQSPVRSAQSIWQQTPTAGRQLLEAKPSISCALGACFCSGPYAMGLVLIREGRATDSQALHCLNLSVGPHQTYFSVATSVTISTQTQCPGVPKAP